MGTLKAEMEGNKNELLCAFSALMLADGEQEVSADNINAAIKAAGASVPTYYAQLFAKIHEIRPVNEVIESAGKVGSGAPAAKKKTTTEEDDGGMAGGGLFGEEGDDY